MGAAATRAELSVKVAAPTLDDRDLLLNKKQTRVHVAHAELHYGGGCIAVPRGNSREKVAHLVGDVASAVRVIETKLAIRVPAPALDLVGVQKRAGVPRPSPDARSCSGCAKCGHRKVVAHLVGAVAAVVDVAEPKLSVQVVSPALDAAVVEQRTRMVRTDCNLPGSAAGAQ